MLIIYVRSKSISRVLSWIIICLGLLSPTSSSEQPYWTVSSKHPTVPFVLAPDGVYIAYLSLDSWWALTSPFQPYQKTGGILSVALAWRSLLLDVIKHPRSMVHGLSSWTNPRDYPIYSVFYFTSKIVTDKLKEFSKWILLTVS